MINPLFGWIALKLPVRTPPRGVPSPSLLKATTFKKSTKIGKLLSFQLNFCFDFHLIPFALLC